MTAIAYVIGTAMGYPIGALMALGDTFGLVISAALAGVFVILVFRYTASQRNITAAKDTIYGALLGIVLFRHDTAIMFAEEWRLVKGALAHMKEGLKPLAVVIVPMMVIIGQLGLFYSYRPLTVGETAIVTVEGQPQDHHAIQEAVLQAAPGVLVETAALRIPAKNQVCWRIIAKAPGTGDIAIQAGGQTYYKSVVVGRRKGVVRLSPRLVRAGLLATLFESGEPLLPPHCPFQSIQVSYPPAALQVGPWRVHWLIGFMAVAMTVAFAIKGFLGVEL